ncbi:MAG: M64 family metallopeptidase, partial [Planctomycetota bacterium]
MRRHALLLLLATAASSQDASEPARLLHEAEACANRRAYAKARQLYRKILEQFPDSAEVAVAARRGKANAFLRAWVLEENGPHERRIDVYVMGDGFPMEDQDKFDDWADKTAKILFKVDVFQRYRKYFNLRAMNLLSEEDGVDDPMGKREHSTALDAKSLGGGGQVYIDAGLVFDFLNNEVKDHDNLAIILVKRGVLGTGGGGLATTGRPDRTTIVHEWGHAFAGLL